MTNALSGAFLIGLATLLLGCGEESDEVPVSVRLERATAFRQACASAELLRTAQDDVATLESMAAVAASDNPTSPARATLQFARVFHRHAELRAGAYALLDSAARHSPTPADSQRFIQRAAAYSITYPAPGSVEDNVIRSYETKLGAILSDNDHRCNWDIPGMTPTGQAPSR
jgi:hypothetical protein